jgi:hypothetical protein
MYSIKLTPFTRNVCPLLVSHSTIYNNYILKYIKKKFDWLPGSYQSAFFAYQDPHIQNRFTGWMWIQCGTGLSARSGSQFKINRLFSNIFFSSQILRVVPVPVSNYLSWTQYWIFVIGMPWIIWLLKTSGRIFDFRSYIDIRQYRKWPDVRSIGGHTRNNSSSSIIKYRYRYCSRYR